MKLYTPSRSAGVAELVDATDLKSVGASLRAGSIPALGTKFWYEKSLDERQLIKAFLSLAVAKDLRLRFDFATRIFVSVQTT